MAGRGPQPKDPDKRARRNKDPIGLRVVRANPDPQPELTALLGELNPLTEEPWRMPTLLLWRQLGEFPTTSKLQAAQWSSLARAVMIDDAMLSGKVALASEARLRLAKYGIDPDDLARLRVQIVAADEAEEKRSTRGSSRDRRGGLSAAPDRSDDTG